MDIKDINRHWFEFYVQELESSLQIVHKTFDNHYLCPCCYYPTLKRRVDFDICPLCNWEDDGQDNHNADKVLGGCNSNYSLTEARSNFKNYLTSYRPSDKYHFARTTTKTDLLGQVVDLNKIKMQIIELYNTIMQTDNLKERKIIFSKVENLKKQLKD